MKPRVPPKSPEKHLVYGDPAALPVARYILQKYFDAQASASVPILEIRVSCDELEKNGLFKSSDDQFFSTLIGDVFEVFNLNHHQKEVENTRVTTALLSSWMAEDEHEAVFRFPFNLYEMLDE